MVLKVDAWVHFQEKLLCCLIHFYLPCQIRITFKGNTYKLLIRSKLFSLSVDLTL